MGLLLQGQSARSVKAINAICFASDDEKALVLLTAEILAIHGDRVTALSNLLQSSKVFDRENIELAVLDYQMPEMSGTCLAAQLRSAHAKVKVVLFTGALQVPAYELSPVDEVNKSDGVQVLVATVNRLFTAGAIGH